LAVLGLHPGHVSLGDNNDNWFDLVVSVIGLTIRPGEPRVNP
jgi:hypothetical protein